MVIFSSNCCDFDLTEDDTPPSPTPDSQQHRPQVNEDGTEGDATLLSYKPTSTMSYESYKKMTNLVLLHMKHQEQLADLGVYDQFKGQ